jgi:hypothetical protein
MTRPATLGGLAGDEVRRQVDTAWNWGAESDRLLPHGREASFADDGAEGVERPA